MTRRFAAELLGTFGLVGIGTGAIALDTALGGGIGAAGVALAFGLAVASMIWVFADVSGAHLNPAVSMGFWFAGRLTGRELAAYVAAQCVGALLASACLRGLFPDHGSWGTTLPAIPLWGALGVEVLLTMILMGVILQVAVAGGAARWLTGVAVGLTVGLAAFSAGPLTGASMNPARSLGPALVSGEVELIWVYWSAPFAGALLATLLCRRLHGPACCGPGSAR